MASSLLGHALLWLALGAAGFGATAGFVLPRAGKVAAGVFGAAVVLATGLLVGALAANDFSVRYVTKVSSLATPLHLRVAALWAGLDGSLLFWAGLLGLEVGLFLSFERRLAPRVAQLSLGALCAVGAGFLLLLCGPADPFALVAAPPADGPGPAPLLQNHWLMLFHPPALYLGTVATAFPFALAVAALVTGQLSAPVRDALRRWTLVAWLFLTLGIVLGAWWSYAVLGWGGYWAWDPVENASLLPWLTATALLHALKSLERRPALALWTLALAIGTFALTLLGAFLTRGGVVSSVHAFTRSTVGPAFGLMLGAVVLGALVLFGLRARCFVVPAGTPGEAKSLLSREGSLIAADLLLLGLCFVVLLGTLAPLFIEALDGRKIAVGPGYFNRLAAPAAVLMLLVMGVGPALPWGAGSLTQLGRALRAPAAAAALVAAVAAILSPQQPLAAATFGAVAFAATGTLTAWRGPRAMTARAAGALAAHLGLAVALVGITASSAYSIDVRATLSPGEELRVGAHRVRYDGLVVREEPHRRWVAAALTVLAADGSSGPVTAEQGPRLTFYPRRESPISSPGVRSAWGTDLYVVLLGFDPKTKQVGLGAWLFPLVGWIWGALPLLCLGALLALWPRRLDRRPLAAEAAAVPGAPEG